MNYIKKIVMIPTLDAKSRAERFEITGLLAWDWNWEKYDSDKSMPRGYHNGEVR